MDSWRGNRYRFLTLRRGKELNGLMWDNVDLVAGTIRVRKSQTELKGERRLEKPKTRAGFRVIQIGPKLVADLKKWKLACPLSDRSLVLPTESGAPSYRSTNNRCVKATARRAKIKEMSMYHLQTYLREPAPHRRRDTLGSESPHGTLQPARDAHRLYALVSARNQQGGGNSRRPVPTRIASSPPTAIRKTLGDNVHPRVFSIWSATGQAGVLGCRTMSQL